MEFVIDKKQRDIVEEHVKHIDELYNVKIIFANGTAEKVWVTLAGAETMKEMAKV